MREQVEHVPGFQAVTSAHLLRRLDAPAGGEHRQSREQRPFGLRQELVAPVDRGFERPLPRDGGPRPACQQPESIAEPQVDLLDRQHRHASRRQLDRQWNAVEALADARDRCSVAGRHRKGVVDRSSPLDEQTGRFEPRQPVRRERRTGLRDHERSDPPHRFAGHAQRLTAGGNQAHAGRRAQQRFGDVGRCVDQVLAVVEHDHRAPLP